MSNSSFAPNDAKIFARLLKAGFADSATLTIASVPTDCTVVIDRDVQAIGSDGQVIGPKTTACFLLEEVTPIAGGSLLVGIETWRLISELSKDESVATWILAK